MEDKEYLEQIDEIILAPDSVKRHEGVMRLASILLEEVGVKVDGKQISVDEWFAKRIKARDKDLCPCDNHPADQCETCRGACSCHWEEDGDG